MRLSPATMVFIGKMYAIARTGRVVASPTSVEASNAKYAGLLMFSVKEAGGAPDEKLVQLDPSTLSIFGGVRGRGELTLQTPADGVATLTSGGKTYRFACPAAEDRPWGEAVAWAENWRVDDPQLFRAALVEALRTASKAGDKKKGDEYCKVILDKGEALATDGHRAATVYTGLPGGERLQVPRALAEAWIAMLGVFEKSSGGWWLKTIAGEDDDVCSGHRAALVFVHFGQEAMVAGDLRAPNLKPSVRNIRGVLATNLAPLGAKEVQLPPETAALCRLFDAVALYENGEVLAWEAQNRANNGSTGKVLAGPPLTILDAKYMLAALPRGKRTLAVVAKVDAQGVTTIGETVVMNRRDEVPKLPEDCYEETEEAANDAAA